MKTSIRKRLLSLFLALAMLAALTPAAVAVDGAESGDGAGIVQDGNSQDDGTQETVVPSSDSLSQTTMSLKSGGERYPYSYTERCLRTGNYHHSSGG